MEETILLNKLKNGRLEKFTFSVKNDAGVTITLSNMKPIGVGGWSWEVTTGILSEIEPFKIYTSDKGKGLYLSYFEPAIKSKIEIVLIPEDKWSTNLPWHNFNEIEAMNLFLPASMKMFL